MFYTILINFSKSKWFRYRVERCIGWKIETDKKGHLNYGVFELASNQHFCVYSV